MNNNPPSPENHAMFVGGTGGCPELSTTMAEASADASAVHDLHHSHLHFEGGTLDDDYTSWMTLG